MSINTAKAHIIKPQTQSHDHEAPSPPVAAPGGKGQPPVCTHARGSPAGSAPAQCPEAGGQHACPEQPRGRHLPSAPRRGCTHDRPHPHPQGTAPSWGQEGCRAAGRQPSTRAPTRGEQGGQSGRGRTLRSLWMMGGFCLCMCCTARHVW